MTPQTRGILVKAIRGEAVAFVKFMLFAQRTRRNGREELVALFEETAESERTEHFTEEAARFAEVGRDEMEHRDAFKVALERFGAVN